MNIQLNNLNWAGWVILILQLLNLIMMPFLFGREREPYKYGNFIGAIIGLIIILIALNIIN